MLDSPAAQRARAVQYATWSGLSSLLLTIALLLMAPHTMGTLPEGMKTPLVALELARSQTEVDSMFQTAVPAQQASWQRALTRVNQLDYVFMLTYSAFLFYFARVVLPFGARVTRLAGGLAWLAGSADALENLCLFSITSDLGQNHETALMLLSLSTWTKWFALALSCATWAFAPREARPLSRALQAALMAVVAITGAAFLRRGLFAELMMHTIAVCLVGAFAYTVVLARKGRASRVPLTPPVRVDRSR